MAPATKKQAIHRTASDDEDVTLYRQAAAQGDAEARYRLGAVYLRKAKSLFQMAADQDYEAAKQALEECAKQDQEH